LTEVAEAAAGDARIAIGILRAAAREADEKGLDRITDDLIKEGIPEAKAEIRQKHVQKLTEHQRVLYDIIVERGEVSPSGLYEAYCTRVDDSKSQRMMRNHLQKMQRYNLIRAEGQSRSRTLHPN
jgi:Cdc6-like AAA superfamily ATPase